MCIIIDANKMSVFLSEPPNEDVAPIHDWLSDKNKMGKIVYATGGKFDDEIGRRARERLTVYYRSGRAIRIDADAQDFRRDESSLAPKIRSDDPHVLALARASGARRLYTDDAKLMDDFTDKRFIDGPRGKVYKYAKHAKTLLTKKTCA